MSYIPTEDGLTAMLTAALPGWQLQPWALRDTSDNTTKICAFQQVGYDSKRDGTDETVWQVELRASRDDTLGNTGTKVACDAIIAASETIPTPAIPMVGVFVTSKNVGGFTADGRPKADITLRVINNA